MGIQDRDYIRKRRSSDVPSNNEPSVVISQRWWFFIGIVLAISLVFIISGNQSSNRTATVRAHPDQVRSPVINVNNASLEELDALPRISETMAQAIIDGRPYSSTDDLIRVYGIGPKTLELIRPYVSVKDDHPQP